MGAGPGPTTTYKVDAPFPWGDNTAIVLPVQAMVDDAWSALQPHINEFISDVEGEAGRVAPDLARKVIAETVTPEIQKQMEIAFAKADMLKASAIKAAVGLTVVLVGAVGAAAWWVKKG
jgi:hypothetical protein